MTDLADGANRKRCHEWLSAHEPWLRKVILARTREPQAVDDVFQQLALAVVQYHETVREPERHPAWLHRMAVLHSLRHRRQLGRSKRVLDKLASHKAHQQSQIEPDVFQFLLHRERNELTRTALHRLPSRDVELLLMKYDLRWSYRRIAEHLGIPEKTVDSRLLRARDRLRNEILKRQIEPGDL